MGGHRVKKRILKEINGTVWIAFIWLMIGTTRGTV